MAVMYNRHRQKVDFSRHFDYKRNCSPQDSPERVSVKYVNKRCSPEHIHKGNTSPDQNKITITVKMKNIQQRKPAERVKTAPSLVTINDYLKVLAKKCSTPDIRQPYVLKNQKRMRCSDTCVNNSTPFITKTIVNTVSLDPKKIPADCKNLLNHPLMQAQLSIYQCQLKTEKDNVCRTCNSTAIFEVVKCLYDCYKKKKCDPCKCVVCGYLPKDIRKLINEVSRSKASIGVETPITNRVSKSTMTSQEDELLSMLQCERKQKKQLEISASEKLRIAKAFGIMAFPSDVDKEKNNDSTNTTDAPCPDDEIELEKWLYRTNVSDASPSIRVPSKKLRKARASGLLQPLDGKTQGQREKMLRRLAMNDVPLPEGNTESEKIVITKVRRELGLPPGPTTFAEKERYAKAQAAGIITPLSGKSLPQKENILRTLLENGIPLPEGRTAPEKALIEKIQLDFVMKPVTKSDIEKTIKSKARSYVHTLFNKFANESGYMVLVETSCVKDRLHNLQVADLLAPLEGEESVPHHIWPTETKSLKALFKMFEIGERLIPNSLGKIQIEKVSRRTEKECTEQRDGQIYSKKSNKRQLNSGALLEEIITKSKETRLAVTKKSKNTLSRSRTSLKNLFERKVKDKARASNVVIGRTNKAKGSKSESEQVNAVKGLAKARLSLTHDYVPLDKEYIYKFRDKPKVLDRKTWQSNEIRNADSQKISTDMVTKLISKLVSHLREDLENNGARAAKRERDVIYKIKKPSFRNSYLTINLSMSDASDETRKETRSVFTDTKDIILTSNIATSIPSIPNYNSTEADDAKSAYNIPTKEINKKKNKRNANTKKKTPNSVYFHFDSDDTETVNQSDNYERDYEENADLFYIYKPNFDVNAEGMTTTSSRIILTDPYNVSPSTSGSLYLIETGSTDCSCNSIVTDFSSYATKDTSEMESGTDVFYLQQTDDDLSKDTGSEPRIYRFYRNRVVHDSSGRDAKIFLVSEVTMQQRNEPHQRTRRLDLYRRCNDSHSSRNQQEAMQPDPRVLRQTSSVFILVSPSGNDEFSSEEVGSLIYVEKLDSVSKLKNVKIVRHENTQKLNPIKMCRRHTHTRNEEKVIKHCTDSRTLKCPENSKQTGRTSHKLPIANAFTNHPSNVTTNGENKLEYSNQCQKQRIHPKCSDNQSMTAGGLELAFNLSSCSTTCRLGLNRPEKRIECSGKQPMQPKHFEIQHKDGSACGNKYPPYKTYTRYLHSSKRDSYQEKESKCNPKHRLVTKNSKVCLISTAHSSKYRVGSKVSFSDELRYIVHGKLSGACMEKCVDPESSTKDPPVKPKECKISNDSSSRGSSDEKEKRKARKAQFKIQFSPKSSNVDLKSERCSKGSKVHFDRTLSSCCPCEKKEPQQPFPCKESKRRGIAKKAPQQSDSDLSNEESKPCDKKKEEAQQDNKKQSRPCDKKERGKKENNQCKDQQADLKATKCKAVTEESSEDAKKDSREPNCLAQTSDDKQGSLSCSSQFRETVKRATSPLNVDMKSVGVDSSCSKPNDAEESRTGCREIITEKPQRACDDGSDTVKAKKHTCGGRKPTDCPDKQAVNEKQMASVPPALSSTRDVLKQPADDICQRKRPQCPASNTTDPIMQSTRQCAKQQMMTDQLCPPNATQKQPTDECIKINQKMESECAELKYDDSTTTAADGNDKQMTSKCPANSTRNSISQPAEDNAKLNEQTAECPANATQDSKTQPADDNAKSNEQTAPECPTKCNNTTCGWQNGLTNQPCDECAKQQIVKVQFCPPNPTEEPVKPCLSGQQEPAYSAKERDICPKSQKTKQKDDSITEVVDCNAKLNEQTAECPANATQDSKTQPTDDNAKLKEQAAECPTKCTEGLTNQASDECAKQQMVKERYCPPNSTEDPVKPCLSGQQEPAESEAKETDICSKSQKKKKKDGAPCGSYSYGGKELTQQSDTHENNTCDSKNKKYGKIWWCRKKQVLLRRPDHPSSPVEEHTAETQCERDVKDLAQMTDDLLRNAGDLEQCHCGGTVKPCKCLQELAENMSLSSGCVTSAKTTSDYKCPQPQLKLHVRGQNENELNSLGKLTDQKPNCSCEAFQQQNNIDCQCKTEQSSQNQNCECQTLTAAIAANQDVGGKVQREQAEPYIHTMNDCCHCPQGQNTSGNASNVNMRNACRAPTVTEQTTADGKCPSVKPASAGKKVTCECPHPILTRPTPAVKNEADGTCASARPGPTKQTGAVQCQLPGPKNNIVCECPVPKPIGQAAAGQNATCGTCQGNIPGPGDKKDISCECPGPTAIVKEHTTGVQCENRAQRSCDDLAKVDPCQGNEKSGAYKQTVICESPSKDKLQLAHRGDKKAYQKDQKKRRLSLSLVKKKLVLNGDSGSDDGSQNKCRVKWSQKKYVISECPPLPSEGECGSECTYLEKKKQLKQNAKNQAKIKTKEKKVDTSCTHGGAPCLCKDEPLCRQKKNHKCECPCPLLVEEVDLNPVSDPCGKKNIICECPVPNPIGQAAAGQNDTCETCQGIILPPPCPPKEMKKVCEEGDQVQVTKDKKDKCSYTDRLIKNISKTKNKASGQGKWGKKKKKCICPPEPPTEERGCDPPCVREQWRMRSQETCSKSGFSVRKKPAPRVDHTMCFEEALAYFEQHPEDDPMRKRKKTVTCECPPQECSGLKGYLRTAIPYCLSRQ